VLAGEVDELPADLERGKIDEVLGGLEGGGVEGAEKANGGILDDVIGVIPAADGAKRPEHPVGHFPHPPDDEADDLLARRPITGLECRKKLVEPAEGVGSRHRSRSFLDRRQAS
jgi:hypothetical protein